MQQTQETKKKAYLGPKQWQTGRLGRFGESWVTNDYFIGTSLQICWFSHRCRWASWGCLDIRNSHVSSPSRPSNKPTQYLKWVISCKFITSNATLSRPDVITNFSLHWFGTQAQEQHHPHAATNNAGIATTWYSPTIHQDILSVQLWTLWAMRMVSRCVGIF